MVRLRLIAAAERREVFPQALWWKVIAASVSAQVPLLFFLPLPLGAIVAAALLVKIAALFFKRPRWAIYLLAPLFLSGLVTLYLYYPTQGANHSFIGLLAVATAGKLLETRNSRDMRILFLLALSLFLAVLIHAQSIAVFSFLLVSLALNLYALGALTQRNSRIRTLGRWQEVVKLLSLALPFAIVLFVFFPRIDPLWGLPRSNPQAVTGLPDAMSLGDISELVRSDAVAFRVRFAAEQIPASQLLYWRGPVLWSFDGRKWQQRPSDFSAPRETLTYIRDSEIHYTLIPVKPGNKWLTPLELPVALVQKARIGSAWQIRLPEQKKGADRYTLVSATGYRLNAAALSLTDRHDALQLPDDLALPRTRALAERLYREAGENAAGFAEAFLRYVRDNKYYYSLAPLPGAGNVETFLFEQKIGFCEHFANAMTVAARSVGIPARIVIGYQGGAYNPISGDWVVREENAHAWVELWLRERGWTRFDPTAAVAPSRIRDAGLDGALLGASGENRALGSRLAEKIGALAWFRDAVDATQSFWQNWVIDLNDKRQASLFSLLGLGHWLPWQLVGGVFVIFAGFSILWYFLRHRKHDRRDALEKSAQRLLGKLRKRGVQRLPGEPFGSFLSRIGKQPEAADPERWAYAAKAYRMARYYDPAMAPIAEKLITRLDKGL